MRKTGKTILSVLAAALLLGGCGLHFPVVTADPYAGMVQVESGYGTKMWVKKYDDVPVNPLRDWDGEGEGVIVGEDGARFVRRTGVDVSEHQREIDWAALSRAGQVEFAIIRAGYRGYGAAGRLVEDAFFRRNLAGAQEAGLDVGVYFFSQATSVEEAAEEAEFVLGLLADAPPETLELPVFFDWEYIEMDEARTDDMANELITDCAIAFCDRLRAAGYDAGMYGYRALAYFGYDLSRITDYPFWVAAVGRRPDYYYAFAVWQYSVEGDVAGISGPVDLDAIFTPLDPPEPTPTPEPET